MALITCPECGAQVSSVAASCIKCGCPLTKTKLCFECKANIADNASICPNCGRPQNLVQVRLSDDEKTQKWIPISFQLSKWRISTKAGFKRIIFAEGTKHGDTVEFTLDKPTMVFFQTVDGILPSDISAACTVSPGRNYKVYATGLWGWHIEEDA